MREREGGGRRGWTSPSSYLWRNLFTAGLVFQPILSLGVVEGRLGVGVSECRRWVVVVLMVGVLGAQVELCKIRRHATGFAEGLGASDNRRRRRGGGAVAALKSGQV